MNETIAETISRIAKEHGVDPNNLEFRAKLTRRLIAAGYFSRTSTIK